MKQRIWNPTDFGFEWAGGWYRWDAKAGHRAARASRDRAFREAKAQGLAVSRFALPDQLISKGGIGSGQPHVEFVVTGYGLNIL